MAIKFPKKLITRLEREYEKYLDKLQDGLQCITYGYKPRIKIRDVKDYVDHINIGYLILDLKYYKALNLYMDIGTDSRAFMPKRISDTFEEMVDYEMSQKRAAYESKRLNG